jgi:hypothetical protein
MEIKELKQIFYAENNGKVFRIYERENNKYDAVVDNSEKNYKLIVENADSDMFIEIECRYNVCYEEVIRFFIENGLKL